MPDRGHRDDPPAAGRERGPEPVGQREVAQVVGRELRLPAGADAGLRVGHDGCVVDQDVDRPPGGEEAVSGRADAAEVREVQLVDLDPLQTGELLAGMIRAACRHQDGGSGGRQRTGGREADAGVPAGDDGEHTGEVQAGQDVGGSAVPAKAAADRVLRGALVDRHAFDRTRRCGLRT